MVVRHEVFHRLDGRAAAPAAAGGLPTFADRIDYDVAPSTVYSLYLHVGRPDGMRFDRVDAGNPDWLNRMLMRLKECELGSRFRRSADGQAIPSPSGTTGRRAAFGARRWTGPGRSTSATTASRCSG